MADIIKKASARQKDAKNGKKAIESTLKALEEEVINALPPGMTPERFKARVLYALTADPRLGECTPASLVGAMMTAVQLGLEPNSPLGQAFLLPRRHGGVTECQFVLGYKGLLDLVYRSGEVTTVQAHTVYSRDEFQYELGIEPKLRHVPASSDRGEPTAYYAVFRTKSGGYGFQVMSAEEMTAHAQRYGQEAGDSPSWATDFEDMAKKTVLKKLLRYAPLKAELAQNIAQDGAVKTGLAPQMADVPDKLDLEGSESKAAANAQ